MGMIEGGKEEEGKVREIWLRRVGGKEERMRNRRRVKRKEEELKTGRTGLGKAGRLKKMS
jgi:hypothetical protein